MSKMKTTKKSSTGGAFATPLAYAAAAAAASLTLSSWVWSANAFVSSGHNPRFGISIPSLEETRSAAATATATAAFMMPYKSTVGSVYETDVMSSASTSASSSREPPFEVDTSVWSDVMTGRTIQESDAVVRGDGPGPMGRATRAATKKTKHRKHTRKQEKRKSSTMAEAEMSRPRAAAAAGEDPALVEFADSHSFEASVDAIPEGLFDSSSSLYPMAVMMHGSAPYIAAHSGQIAVFHIPGELLLEGEDDGDDKRADGLLSDIALAWLLGMKIVLVVGSRSEFDGCPVTSSSMDYPHECHNALRVTDDDIIRHVEEEAGFLRTEVERKLNRHLRLHGAVGPSADGAMPPEGNVVSGNFYAAQHFGVVRGRDYEYTGHATAVHANNIKKVLDNNDVVLLTTAGVSCLGEIVNVNGYHLAAKVASSLDAYKVVYMANQGSVLTKKDTGDNIQELPLSFAKAITDYYRVRVHNTGYATFESAKKALDPSAVELLLHLGWSSWALENGVKRAHIVNPADGALLEELFTSKNGANTCLYRNEERDDMLEFFYDDEEEEDDEDEFHSFNGEEWEDYFDSVREQEQGQPIPTFSSSRGSRRSSSASYFVD